MPVLTDGVVTLRAHHRDDIPAIVEQCTDPEQMRWTTVPRTYRKADAARFLAGKRAAWLDPTGVRYWAIEWVDDDGMPRYGGTIDLRPAGGGVAEIGYGLHPDARGRGLMARAVRLVCRWGFEEGLAGEPLERVHWAAVVGNFASRRVAWSTGFTLHGTVPQMSGPSYDDGTGRRVARDHWIGSLGRHDRMRPQVPWLDIPTLEADGIRIRAWRDDDGQWSEPLVSPGHHMPAGAVPDDLTFDHWLLVRRERAAKGEGIAWCIADAESDRPLGAVLVFDHGRPISEPGAELGYFLFPSARGRGVATRAAELAIDHAFAPASAGGLGLSRLSAITAADNDASNSVLERLGFMRWGTEHETDHLPDGTTADAYHWELLASTR